MEKIKKTVQNIQQQWVLIFWTKTEDISVINKGDFRGILKPALIKEGWIGNIPWVECGNLEYYEGKILRVSTDKEYLLSLHVSTSGQIFQNKFSPREPKVKDDNVISPSSIKYFPEDGKHTAELTDRGLEETEGSSKVANAETCANCKKCICRDWASLVTPEIVAAIIAIAESLKKAPSSENALPRQRDNNDFIANEVSQVMNSPVYNNILNMHVPQSESSPDSHHTYLSL